MAIAVTVTVLAVVVVAVVVVVVVVVVFAVRVVVVVVAAAVAAVSLTMASLTARSELRLGLPPRGLLAWSPLRAHVHEVCMHLAEWCALSCSLPSILPSRIVVLPV